MPKNSATIIHDLSILAKLPTHRLYNQPNAQRSFIQVKIGTKKRIEQYKIKQLLRKHFMNHLDFIDNGRGGSTNIYTYFYYRDYDDYDDYDYYYDYWYIAFAWLFIFFVINFS